jgi:hypothetical protein
MQLAAAFRSVMTFPLESSSRSIFLFEHDLSRKTGGIMLQPAARPRIWRFGKRLGDEIYVASEASATPQQSYAP